jgi:pimeloyl-ACP methyl ester carboxylesterase
LHGAGLGSWIWEKVLPELNYPAEALDLPGRNGQNHPAEVTLQQCIDYVAGKARGYRAVIVGHSFSAEVAMGVATTYPQHVAAVVLVGGVLPKSGKSFMSLVPFPQRLILSILLRRAKDGIRLPPKMVTKEYCNDLDQETTELVLSRLVPEAPRLYLDRLKWAAMPSDIPRLYVKLLNDKSVPPKKQDEMTQRIAPTRLETLNTGHLPMLAQPRAMAAVLNRYGI